MGRSLLKYLFFLLFLFFPGWQSLASQSAQGGDPVFLEPLGEAAGNPRLNYGVGLCAENQFVTQMTMAFDGSGIYGILSLVCIDRDGNQELKVLNYLEAYEWDLGRIGGNLIDLWRFNCGEGRVITGYGGTDGDFPAINADLKLSEWSTFCKQFDRSGLDNDSEISGGALVQSLDDLVMAKETRCPEDQAVNAFYYSYDNKNVMKEISGSCRTVPEGRGQAVGTVAPSQNDIPTRVRVVERRPILRFVPVVLPFAPVGQMSSPGRSAPGCPEGQRKNPLTGSCEAIESVPPSSGPDNSGGHGKIVVDPREPATGGVSKKPKPKIGSPATGEGNTSTGGCSLHLKSGPQDPLGIVFLLLLTPLLLSKRVLRSFLFFSFLLLLLQGFCTTALATGESIDDIVFLDPLGNISGPDYTYGDASCPEGKFIKSIDVSYDVSSVYGVSSFTCIDQEGNQERNGFSGVMLAGRFNYSLERPGDNLIVLTEFLCEEGSEGYVMTGWGGTIENASKAPFRDFQILCKKMLLWGLDEQSEGEKGGVLLSGRDTPAEKHSCPSGYAVTTLYYAMDSLEILQGLGGRCKPVPKKEERPAGYGHANDGMVGGVPAVPVAHAQAQPVYTAEAPRRVSVGGVVTVGPPGSVPPAGQQDSDADGLRLATLPIRFHPLDSFLELHAIFVNISRCLENQRENPLTGDCETTEPPPPSNSSDPSTGHGQIVVDPREPLTGDVLKRPKPKIGSPATGEGNTSIGGCSLHLKSGPQDPLGIVFLLLLTELLFIHRSRY